MKTCDIFKTKDSYKIVTQSESDTGLLLSDTPVYILPIEIKIEDLKIKIFDSLNNSRTDVKMPNTKEEFSNWQKEQLKDLQEKSFISLYKNSTNCQVKLNNEILKVCPSKYSEKYKGMISVKEDVIEFNYSKDKEHEITQRIMEVLNVIY